MNTLACIYCENNYNMTSRMPIKLECGHSLCKNCADELNYYLATCPLDKIKVNYAKSSANQDILKILNESCLEHLKPIIAYCKNHLIILCEVCSNSHTNCKVIKENLSKNDLKLTNDFKEANLEAIETHKKTQMLNLFELSLLLDAYLEIFNKTKNISTEILECKFDVIDFLRDLQVHNEIFSIKFLNAQKNMLRILTEILIFNPILNDLMSFEKPAGISGSYDNRLNQILKNDENRILQESDALIKNLEYFYLYFTRLYENTNPKNYSKYMANLWQLGADALQINIIGFGNPINPDGYILIINLQLYIDDQIIWSLQNFIIQKQNNMLCYFLLVPFTIYVPKGNKIFFLIEMEGTPHYLFFLNHSHKFIKITDVNDQEYSGVFPVMFLGYIADIRILSTFS